ncbi:superfamily I DNA and RNA helicase and helicase subunit [Magnetococcus marinus MC-1]|uniref:Superfamily I DNA and RNA helicase and helicase subunit n=1 Tax=Magnetococcus marinus (strain ATCC BAA-1437 / JCM 17883 / MC-1) TaxID=156889 RepID=A0L4F1_MAGMM|nr:DUF3320 domain-containing protein [Magnetococcus marinus]ABK42844.1 superfamily I DNA and RNA helicase and helicase subunit [Magnetococcus marinus MC-1]
MDTLILHVSVQEKINFATQQNAVPILRELSIENIGQESVANLRLTLTSNPVFLVRKTWHLDQLEPGLRLTVSDRDIRLDAGLLMSLHESLRGDLRVELYQDDLLLVEKNIEVELLARHQWGGSQFMPEMLAAFIEPNDTFIAEILRSASSLLQKNGLESGLDGYQKDSSVRVGEVVSAIWSAIAALGITYAEPPASFEQNGQKIRLPSIIKQTGLATCLDLALLFASAMEQAGLNSLIIITQDHAFPGVWLKPQTFPTVLIKTALDIRKRFDLQELLVFESTFATSRTNPVPFHKAVKKGRAQLEEHGQFYMAIDVQRARMYQIRPLYWEDQCASKDQLNVEQVSSMGVDLLEFSDQGVIPEQESLKPTTASGRLELWQKKLLDLSLRNKLLNFKLNGSSALVLICPDPGLLEDKLAQKMKLSIESLPEMGSSNNGRDAQLHTQRTGGGLIEEFVTKALEKNQLYVQEEKEALDKRLTSLFRRSKADLDEGGANTLYLALGFLIWWRSNDPNKKYYAPLILIPVTLERKSIQSGVRMVLHEDEPRFNTTLLQMLRQDFRLEIPGLEGELPTDTHGVDVHGIWHKVRHHVRDVEGFEVVEEVALSNFSFAKYLMWKDLVDRTEQLKENRVVRHLLETPQQSYASDISFREPRNLDNEVKPQDLLTPLPADSSQQTAVMASGEGKDFIVIGPPGTGKSQTIANMIAHNLGLGRTVLFVSEKAAALNVVYRRLKEQGLGEFCLELHSNKARKLEVLNQFDQAWRSKSSFSQVEWQREANRLKETRDGLNRYVQAMHQPSRHGMTPYQAIGKIALGDTVVQLELSFAHADIHDHADYVALTELCHKMDLYSKDLGSVVAHELAFVTHDDWTPQWVKDLLASAHLLKEQADRFQQSIKDLYLLFGYPDHSITILEPLLALIGTMQDLYEQDASFLFEPNTTQIVQQLDVGMRCVQEFTDEQDQLSCCYQLEGLLALDIDALTKQWQESQQAWWLRGWFIKRRVNKALKYMGGAVGQPQPHRDLPRIKQMKKKYQQLQELDAVNTCVRHWRGLESDLAVIQRLVKGGQQVKARIQEIAPTPTEFVTLQTVVQRWLIESNTLLAPNGTLLTLSARVKEQRQQLMETYNRVISLTGGEVDEFLPLGVLFGRAQTYAATLIQNESKLNTWCRWQAVRKEACAQGLRPLVEAMEKGLCKTGKAEQVFEINYARWWIHLVFAKEPDLRQFSAVEHEDKIRIFRMLDERFSELTREYICAKQGANIPDQSGVTQSSEYGVLKRELHKKIRHKPVRQLFREIPNVVKQLTPCLLMSPLSIAQYLPTEKENFDLVIFDEASQITVWDAIGSLARGKQVVIAGDPKQLPPTSFFGRREAEDEGDDTGDVTDLESILDEMMGCSIPQIHLNWHYRSAHESLIAFSNQRYYMNKLITFPSAVTVDRALRLVTVEGYYDRGGARHNRAEAEAIVTEVVRRLNDPNFAGAGKSIGVVTFNSEQQRLIEDLLDRARRDDPALEPYFADEQLEPVIVKNLESVQGDERDLILFSVTYGPDRAGHMTMNFGPLNKQGGERRLNVAITRARSELIVFSTLKPEQMDLSRTQANGVVDLKDFLRYADRGKMALDEVSHGSIGGYDSPFEEAVSEALTRKGWRVHSQIGVSAFRIDLGIVHPQREGHYFVGVECDGATYHSSATARDRDKVREAILERLGWRLVRVWSLDWWVNPKDTLEKLDQRIQAILAEVDIQIAREEEIRKTAEEAFYQAKQAATAALFEENGAKLKAESATIGELSQTSTTDAKVLQVRSMQADKEDRSYYRIATFEKLNLKLNPDLFYEYSYTPTVRMMVEHILEIESPIREDLLIRRIAQAHGFKRSGRLIVERVMQIVEETAEVTHEEGVGNFLWKRGVDLSSWSEIRYPQQGEREARRPDEIAIQELMTLAKEHQGEGALIDTMARSLGVFRLNERNRTRLQLAAQMATKSAPVEPAVL